MRKLFILGMLLLLPSITYANDFWKVFGGVVLGGIIADAQHRDENRVVVENFYYDQDGVIHRVGPATPMYGYDPTREGLTYEVRPNVGYYHKELRCNNVYYQGYYGTEVRRVCKEVWVRD